GADGDGAGGGHGRRRQPEEGGRADGNAYEQPRPQRRQHRPKADSAPVDASRWGARRVATRNVGPGPEERGDGSIPAGDRTRRAPLEAASTHRRPTARRTKPSVWNRSPVRRMPRSASFSAK